MRQNQKRQLYISQYFSNMVYNTKYNLIKLFQQYKKDSFTKINDNIYILGKKFTVNKQNQSQVQQQIFQIFQKTPWFTYRSGYPQLPNSVQKSYVSDTGWGCMVRVGQMLFAQVIKKHMKIQDKGQILKILQLFSDYDQNQQFSIHKIVRTAIKLYGLQPGQWYNPSQISFILQKLYKDQLIDKYGLNFIVFNSGNLFFDQLLNQMIQKQNICKCKKKQQNKFICVKCNKKKRSIACIILCRLGLNSPQKKYLLVLQKLMEIQYCQGIIGGKPDKALYFIGKQDQYFIYLDPHYVQKAQKETIKKQTYFCQSLRKCKNTSIDSSLGICFYLRDLKELNKFHQEINKIKKQNQDNFFIYLADQTPKYMMINSNQVKIVKSSCGKNDGFQIL